jgi:DNA-binding response OmpR family regulator
MTRGIKFMLGFYDDVMDTVCLNQDGLETGNICDYGLTFLNIMLPDIDGRAILRHLRNSRGNTKPTLHPTSAASMRNYKTLFRCRRLPLPKPFENPKLIAHINATILRSK